MSIERTNGGMTVWKIVVVGALTLGGLQAITTEEATAQNRCSKGKITCEQWCHKYRPLGLLECKTTHRLSCEKVYGGLKACVDDRPPRNR
jgi:hypothetical protein